MCHEPCCQIMALRPPHSAAHSQFGAELSDGAAPRVDLSKLKVSHPDRARPLGLDVTPPCCKGCWDLVCGRRAFPLRCLEGKFRVPCPLPPLYTLGGPFPGCAGPGPSEIHQGVRGPGHQPAKQQGRFDQRSQQALGLHGAQRGKAFAAPGAGPWARLSVRGAVGVCWAGCAWGGRDGCARRATQRSRPPSPSPLADRERGVGAAKPHAVAGPALRAGPAARRREIRCSDAWADCLVPCWGVDQLLGSGSLLYSHTCHVFGAAAFAV